jgi:hypothetical protein
MVVNCVLPFLHGLARLRGDGELARLSLEAYRACPRLQENEITREMGCLLSEPLGEQGEWRRAIDSARRQQGLLHLHRVLASLGSCRA